MSKRVFLMLMLAVLVLPLAACDSGVKADLTGMSVVMFIADGFNYEEANSTINHLKKLGAAIIISGASLGEKSPHDAGQPMEVTKLAKDISPEECAGVVVPGGMPEHINALKGNGDVVALIQAMDELGKLTAAVCAGPAVLGHAGVLEGRKVIATSSLWTEAPAWGATWASNSMVVEEGHIITASGPNDMPMFNAAVVSFLAKDLPTNR